MDRRNISRVLLGSALGAAVLTDEARGQTCSAPCYPMTAAESASGYAINTQYPWDDVRRYGADMTGLADSTNAFNRGLALNTACHAVDGVCRMDGTITIGDGQSLYLSASTQLIRKAVSGNTAPVVHVKGTYALFAGGSVVSENNSPGGVVCCGHLSTSGSNWVSEFWTFRDCGVYCKNFGGSSASPYPGDGDGIGVYIPSSQPQLGTPYVNYFGCLQNVRVFGATTAYMLTDLANGHTFSNCTFRGIYWYGFRLHGAYGNSFYGGFLEQGYKDGVIAIWLAPKLNPSAPHASSLESVRNHFHGFTMELDTSSNIGLHVGVPTCTNNFAEFAWNSTGTAVNDVSHANTVVTDATGATFGGLVLNAATPTGSGTQISLGNTTSTSVGGAGGAAPLPVTPLGYLVLDYGGSKVKVPYFKP